MKCPSRSASSNPAMLPGSVHRSISAATEPLPRDWVTWSLLKMQLVGSVHRHRDPRHCWSLFTQWGDYILVVFWFCNHCNCYMFLHLWDCFAEASDGCKVLFHRMLCRHPRIQESSGRWFVGAWDVPLSDRPRGAIGNMTGRMDVRNFIGRVLYVMTASRNLMKSSSGIYAYSISAVVALVSAFVGDMSLSQVLCPVLLVMRLSADHGRLVSDNQCLQQKLIMLNSRFGKNPLLRMVTKLNHYG